MKRRFTILTAALALLVSLAIPMGMWGQTTETLNIASYASANSWVNQTQYATATVGSVTFTADGGSNTGKYYTTDNSWRFYANESATLTISVPSGNTLSSVTATFTVKDNGTVSYNNSTISSGVAVTVSGNSAVFNIGQSSGNKGKIFFTEIAVTYTSGDTPTPSTYTVTYNANGGTGSMTDSNSPYNAGVTVTVLGNEFTRTDYEFDHWNTAADDSGTDYDEGDTFTINANTTLYAQWTENTTPGPGGDTQTLTFNLSSNPGGWPTTNSTTLTNYTYTLNGVDYTFALKNVKCNSGYLMMTATAVLGLPAIEGYKLTKVVASNSSNCSTSVKVGISSSALQESYIAGGAIQTWSTQNSSYTYDLTSTEPNTMYYMYVTSKNAQVLGLELTYEADSSAPAPSIAADDVSITYDITSGDISYTINNEPDPAGTLTASVPQNSWLTLGTVDATVPFTCSQNPSNAPRTEIVTLTYTYNTNETTNATVTVTQAGNPNIVDLISGINAVDTYYTIRGTVVALNARGCVIGDGTGYINFYNGYTAPSVAVDDMVTVSGNMTSYGHIYQFSNYSSNTATIATAESSNYDGTPAVTVITEIPTATYSEGLHLSDYFQFEGTLTKSDGYYYVAVGEGQINIAYPSTTQQNAMNALENKTVRVKGYFAGINSSNYFSVMMESIEEVASTEPSVTVTPATINAPFAGAEGTLTVTYENITTVAADVYFCNAAGTEATYDWVTARVNETNNVDYLIEENEGEARTAYLKVWAYDDDMNEVYSNLVTISQAAPVVPPTPGNWVLTSIDELTENDVFVIVGDNGSAFAMPVDGGGQNGAPAAVAVTVVEGTLSGEPAANLQWNISITDDAYTFYPNGETETWLYCTNSNNGVRVGTNDNKFFIIEDGYLKNVATSRYVGIYNSQDWRCYTSHVSSGSQQNNIEGQTFAFYKKVAEPATETYTLDIEGYGDTQNPGGWYLIASPIGNVAPTNVAIEGIDNANMVSGTFDLFYFDHTKDNEWVNYKPNESGEGNASTDPGFNLISGKGYLYANSEDITLVFTGTAPTDEEVEVTLDYNANAEMPGWNLVGNPFAVPAYFSTERDFYTMNSTGTSFELCTDEERSIEPMQGVFVIAGSNEGSLSFTTSNPNTQGKGIVLKLKGRSNTDAAIVRFGEGRTLPKLQLFKGSTKIYIPQDGKEYAVVRSEEMGAMPVNFKAEENGTYSLNVGGQNTEFAYLHLIDNMTGNDIDLLQTPSYSFEAKTTDYESRFKLVFATGDNSNDDTFAFYSNGSFVINNEGNAELQVIDITGRIVKSESVNGCANVSVNGAAGVYMLRLVNGDNVKTQKVVVK